MSFFRAAAAAIFFSFLCGSGAAANTSTECAESGVEYNGYNILVLSDVELYSQCMLSCANDVDCHYWSWDSEAQTCFLKSAAAILGRVGRDNFVSGPKTCTADESCFEAGVDYFGFDVMKIEGQNIPSAIECQKICLLNPHCAFFSFRASNKGCYLKTSGARVGRIADANVTSGPRVCGEVLESPSFLPQQSCAEGSVEYKGHDVHVTHNVRSASHCQYLCAANSACFYWTWDRSRNTCYEKDAAAIYHSQSGVHTLGKVSGAKNCIPINPGCQQNDTSFQGKVIKDVKSSTFEACQANCQSNRECAFWSWNSSRKLCSLRYSTPFGYVPAPSTIAGPKFCPNNDLCIEQAEYVGYDLESIQDGSVGSATECRSLCRKKEGCELWTWTENGNCYLKTAEALKGKTNNVSSTGTYSGPRECFMSYGCIETNAAYFSPEATRYKEIKSYTECETLCSTESCLVWTYLTSSRICLLGYSITEKISLNGAISGRKDCKAAAEDCFELGVKYDEKELVLDATVTSVAECQKQCYSNSACKTFTFEEDIGCFHYGKTKEKMSRFSTKYPAVVSGPRACARGGYVHDTKQLEINTVCSDDGCRKKCEEMATCSAYTFGRKESKCICTLTVSADTSLNKATYAGYRYDGFVLEEERAKSAKACRHLCQKRKRDLWTYYTETHRCAMYGADAAANRVEEFGAMCGTAEDPLPN